MTLPDFARRLKFTMLLCLLVAWAAPASGFSTQDNSTWSVESYDSLVDSAESLHQQVGELRKGLLGLLDEKQMQPIASADEATSQLVELLTLHRRVDNGQVHPPKGSMLQVSRIFGQANACISSARSMEVLYATGLRHWSGPAPSEDDEALKKSFHRVGRKDLDGLSAQLSSTAGDVLSRAAQEAFEEAFKGELIAQLAANCQFSVRVASMKPASVTERATSPSGVVVEFAKAAAREALSSCSDLMLDIACDFCTARTLEVEVVPIIFKAVARFTVRVLVTTAKEHRQALDAAPVSDIERLMASLDLVSQLLTSFTADDRRNFMDQVTDCDSLGEQALNRHAWAALFLAASTSQESRSVWSAELSIASGDINMVAPMRSAKEAIEWLQARAQGVSDATDSFQSMNGLLQPGIHGYLLSNPHLPFMIPDAAMAVKVVTPVYRMAPLLLGR